MIVLRIAAVISIAVTMVLNAHYGYTSAASIPYAVLLATLSVALDLAKSSLLLAASKAWRMNAKGAALLLFIMFWPCLGYSLYAGVSQIAIARDESKAGKVAAVDIRARMEADYLRLTHDVTLAEASPIYTATSACTDVTRPPSKVFCAALATTKAQLATLGTTLSATTPVNPEPQLILIADVTHWSMAGLRFTVAIWPVLLAEMVGSLGFYLSSRISGKPPEKRVQRASWFAGRWRRPSPKTPPLPGSGALAAPFSPPSLPSPRNPSPPKINWTLPANS